MKTIYITLVFIALAFGVYYVMCYVNAVLGLFAIGLAVHIMDKLTGKLK